MVQLTFKKWLKITITLIVLSIIFYSLNTIYIDKKAIDWEHILLQSIGLPLFITGFSWLWGDITFSKKKKEERTHQEE